MRALSFGTRLALTLLLGSAASGTLAAPPVTPGQVGDTLKPPVPLKPVPPAPTVQAAPQEAPPAAASSKTVVVERFEFAGNTLFSGEELSALIKDYRNRPVTLLEIFEAADRVADFYVSRGYTLASVNVPPQKLEQGTVRLLVSEGRIARIVTEDNRLYTRGQITDYLGEVRPGTVYQGTTLAERIRQINTLPGLQAKAVVKPGERYGTSDLIIKTVEDPASGALIVDNYGRESVGEIRFSAFGQINNPLKVGDQLQLLLLRSEDDLLNYGYLAYALPVNYTGTRLNLSYGEAKFDVASSPGAPDVDGRNRSGRVMLDHPLFAKPTDRINVGVGVSRTYTNADVSGIPTFATSLTLMELSASYTHSHANLAVTQLVANLSSNFDEQTREELDTLTIGETLEAGQRARLELDLQHVQPLANGLQLFAHANGVYSPDPLSDVSQFSLGGPNSVRGYPAAEARGDRGYFGSLSLNRPFTFGTLRVVGRVFADSGRVFGVDAGPSRPPDKTLTSLGFGADFQYDRVSAKFDWSFPREDRESSDGEDDRLFGALAVAF